METADEMKKSRAARLKTAREALGISVADAAKSMGMKYPTYAGHENGTTPFTRDSAERYAKKFKVSLDWLLTGKGKGPGEVDETFERLQELWPYLDNQARQLLLSNAEMFAANIRKAAS